MRDNELVALLVISFLVFAAFLFWAGEALSKPNDRVDVALVLAVDHSASILPSEWKIQMEGYADALQSEAVQASILGGYHRAIGVALFRWSDDYNQQLLIDWRRVDSPESIALLAADIRKLATLPAMGGTCVAHAMVYAGELFDRMPYKAERMVLDVSGDEGGICAQPPHLPDEVRNALVYKGVQVNGLPIVTDGGTGSQYYNPGAELERFYRDRVVGGAGSFLIRVDGYASFGAAVHRKLLQEIASLSPIMGARP